MKFKIDKGLVPIKVHFFFFFAALGPLLPQINVFGRQLGVSPGVMGMVTAVLPLLWAAAKPLFGYVVDFWPAHRKLVFMLLITVMTGSYCCLWFLPMPEQPETTEPPVLEYIYNLNDTIYLKKYNNDPFLDKYTCQWNCSMGENFDVFLSNSTFVNTVYIDAQVTNESCSHLHMGFDDARAGQIICTPVKNCNLLCFEENLSGTNRSRREVHSASNNAIENASKQPLSLTNASKQDVSKLTSVSNETNDNFYMTVTFWAFVVLMCVGTVAFNVANCIGDAVCFDVLGPDHGSKYGAQRAWGTAGYGVTALLGGWLVDLVSESDIKNFTPAFIIAILATIVDLFSCRALNLPSLSSPEDSGKALREVLRIPRVMLFIVFAVIAGTFDSFIIYYMFWFLEEIAEETGYMAKIKLIEGVVIAAQSFIGELLFFYFSGKIINRWGYGTTMTFSLFCYGVRMALIAVIRNPWHLVYIESIMQGPTYALCYSTIVGYAAEVAPPGYSATVQGIVAGMDDGVGFALGSLVGGQLYAGAGGRGSFLALGGAAVVASAAHAALFALLTRCTDKQTDTKDSQAPLPEGEKFLPENQRDATAIYCSTTVPLNEK
ncbi:major facilitator superfamily domain-containing protein 6 isoform X1 [Galleria mellonella]|uniref:Major facilitator superfamily domain-containing protein 6 isoform X1 n=1 Tax=Galleria mellonella TaxID=7137 RepID=A0ABM3MUE3_GALME|nr:major facilitator superfamily domain-containing protein 6 isoform X1 [Galleria mellonella]